MGITYDNDLLTLWLKAGELDEAAVRALIDELQEARDETRPPLGAGDAGDDEA